MRRGFRACDRRRALNIPHRGEIWLADLHHPWSGDEPSTQTRPCLVVQTDLLNDANHPTTVVIPGTSRINRDTFGDAFPLRVPIMRMNEDGLLTRETDLLIDQIRSIAIHRLIGKAPIATVTAQQLIRVQEALQLVLKF
jgi:mRNA interferase MazF